MRLADGVWTPNGGRSDLPQLPLLSMLADAGGRLWFGYTDNRVALIEHEHLRVLGAADGLQIGSASVLYARNGKGDVWIGGPSGVAHYDGQRFRALIGEDGDPFRGVTGIVETAAGELWLNGATGISRIAAAEIEQARRDPQHRVRYHRFDSNDGLDGGASQVPPLPSAVETEDGKLWFSAGNTIVWVDPQHIHRNALMPNVLIRSVIANDRPFATTTDAPELELPIGTTRLQIAYTATSLSMPERMRFRYRLDGIDTRWQEAGTRREAFYTNLGAGTYRFQVIASNDDGVWNSNGATLIFTIAPAFWQTPWFAALCVLAVLGLLRLAYLLRLRQLSLRMRVQLGERHRERERIARELHDTLLQGVHGLVLRFQALSNQLPAESPLRQRMEFALERADELLIEGRNRVAELRSTSSDVTDIGDALDLLGKELSQDRAVDFHLTIEGAPHPLDPLAQDEVHRIGREALLNAFLHADAASINVRVIYNVGGMQLLISDDGRGIDDDILQSGKPGHWGLAGMRERADRIGARLTFTSSPLNGTEIELKVPPSRDRRATRHS
jgi:signal transduction histidine kinase